MLYNQKDRTKPGPLDGIRVIDITTFLLGPFTGQFLGDMGADVIKVETEGGDASRNAGIRNNVNMAAYFMVFNRNKRSISLNLKRPQAFRALMKLLDTADVLLHNMRPAAARRQSVVMPEGSCGGHRHAGADANGCSGPLPR